MTTTGTSTTERPVEEGRRHGASPTRGWVALAVLLGVYVVGAVDRLDPMLLAGLLPGGH